MTGSTIRDVAQLARVSVATVSRVLNGTAPVADMTRERILAATRQLRYAPHGAARSLSSRRSGALGVILPDLHGEFFSELLRGIDQTAQRARHHLLVSSSHHDRAGMLDAVRAMHGRVDGLLVMAPDVPGSSLAEALPRQVPVVLINASSGPSSTVSSLGVDNAGGARSMTRHLLDMGHCRVALICGPPDNADARERQRGYRLALRKAGLARSAIEVPGDFTEGSGWDAAHRLLALREPPTAIFAANDTMAVGALSALRARGLEVPRHMAVGGFDDIPMARYLHPPLSSVKVDISDLGSRAAMRLIEALSGNTAGPPQREVLPATLVVRASCGGLPPPVPGARDFTPHPS